MNFNQFLEEGFTLERNCSLGFILDLLSIVNCEFFLLSFFSLNSAMKLTI